MAKTAFAIVSGNAETESIRAQSEVHTVMQPGQQSDLMHRYEFETLITGEKGTGKTTASVVWLIRGNLDVPDEEKDDTDIYYFNNPLFRAAVVRKNVDDLNSWVEDAKRVYGTEGDKMGATYTSQPREFTWKHSGAKIILLHMGDRDAYMRITGQSVIRLFWDEITFEPSSDVYEKVYSSIRSPHKKLRAQILLGCNPEGPGLPWVKERFPRYRDRDGHTYKSGEVMRIPVVDYKTKETHYVERVYFHWTMAGNPIFVEKDPLYQARLGTMKNESLRKAYLEGDWDAAGGRFFEFRRQRSEYEPENACHVYDASKVAIQPWWPRLIGLDCGFSHYFAAIKIAMSPDGRVWVTDEMAHKGVGSKELGAALARWCKDDMIGLSKCGVPTVIPIFLSPDAIEQRRDVYGTTAENIAEGIMSVFGPGSSEILSSDDPADEFDFLRQVQGISKMPLRRATNKRHFGWDTMRELMVWTSLAEPDLAQYDEAYAEKQLMIGADEYFRYQREFQKKEEALPKLQVSSRLRYLPDALDAAVSSEADLEDIAKPKNGNRDAIQLHDDMLDAARYGLVATRLYKQITTPVENRVESMLALYPGMTDEQKFQVRPDLTRRLQKKTVSGFRVGRGANSGVYIT